LIISADDDRVEIKGLGAVLEQMNLAEAGRSSTGWTADLEVVHRGHSGTVCIEMTPNGLRHTVSVEHRLPQHSHSHGEAVNDAMLLGILVVMSEIRAGRV
jgi:hypothetical protein